MSDAEGLKVMWVCMGDDGKKSEGEMPFKLGKIGKIKSTLDQPFLRG